MSLCFYKVGSSLDLKLSEFCEARIDALMALRAIFGIALYNLAPIFLLVQALYFFNDIINLTE